MLAIKKGMEMKVKVLKTFFDLQLNRQLRKNSIITLNEDRAKELEKLNLVKIISLDPVRIIANLIETNDIEIKIPEKETKEVKKKRRKK